MDLLRIFPMTELDPLVGSVTNRLVSSVTGWTPEFGHERKVVVQRVWFWRKTGKLKDCLVGKP